MTDTFWWHSFVEPGLVTRGRKHAGLLEAEWDAMSFPDLTGKTVLDIGCWDGWFSFKAERAGAAHVVAMDYFVWQIDLGRWAVENDGLKGAYDNRAIPSLYERKDLFDPKGLPGKRGFDTAHAALNSKVEARVADFLTEPTEQFDVVIFAGVLYHLPDPFGGLRRLRELVRELCVIETETREFGVDKGLWWFIPDDGLAHDPTNWWVPNEQGLVEACEAAGFKTVTALPKVDRDRLIVHAA